MSANKTLWVQLGHYIEENITRVGANLSIAISGVNIAKGFIPTVANMTGVDKSKYKIVPQNHFACNLMHVGRDVIIQNNSCISCILYIQNKRKQNKRIVTRILRNAINTRRVWTHLMVPYRLFNKG